MTELTRKQKIIVLAHEMGYRIRDSKCFNPKGKSIGTFNPYRGRYMEFILKRDGVYYHIRFHQLLAYQKYGSEMFKEGLIIRHKDGDGLNNTEDNILLGTDKENASDIPSELRKQRSQSAKETKEKMKDGLRDQILHSHEVEKLSCFQLARKYQISSRTIQSMVQRHNRKKAA